MSDREPGTGSEGSTSVDGRQVVLALVATLGLVVAGVVAPTTDEGLDAADGGPLLLDVVSDLIEWLFGGEGDPACTIQLHSRPTPGDDLTVTILTDGRPVDGADVWFNDRRVGTTDEEGRVTGEVPYSRELRIRVVGQSVTGCEASTEQPLASVDGVIDRSPGEGVGRDAGRELLADGGTALPAPGTAESGRVTAGSGTGPSAPVTAPTLSVPVAAPVLSVPVTPPALSVPATAPGESAPATGRTAGGAAVQSGENESEDSVEVRGRVRIRVVGDPYPGESVRIAAVVEGVPMADAEVRVEGEPVATTDENGGATITVPEDASGRLPVTVERGDFAGTERVRVLDLSVHLRTDRTLLVPGGPADVVATVGDRRANDATLTVDGEERGSLGASGQAAIRLPTDPRAAVVVNTDRQTASVSLLDLYLVPLALFGGALVVVTVLAGRRFGPVGSLAVLAPTGILFGVALVEAYFGRTAGRAAAGLVLGVGLLAVVVLRRRAIADAAGRVDASPRGAAEWVVTWVLAVVGSADRVLGWADAAYRRLVGWVGSLPRSVPQLARLLVAWLRALPSRVLAAVRSVPVTPTTVGAAVAVALVAAGAYDQAGRRGLAALGGVLLLGAVAWWLFLREPPDPADSPTGDDGDATSPSPPGSSGPDGSRGSGASGGSAVRRSIRELWRAFARRVVPGRWRTKTPVEVGRQAVGKGVPKGPVLELTAAFRAVEYGNREPTEALVEDATDAFRSIEAHLPGEGGDAGSPGDPGTAGDAGGRDDPGTAGDAGGRDDPARGGATDGRGDPGSTMDSGGSGDPAGGGNPGDRDDSTGGERS